MRSALLLFLILCLPAAARAEWGHVPVETLVQESDIIVVGTLRDVSGHTADDVDYGQGYIDVREVIWGRVSPGDSLLLKWSNPSAILCPRVEHGHAVGKEGVWLLTSEGEAVGADYPGRFVETAERRQVERALARWPVVLRSNAHSVDLGGPLTFRVVYRNVSDAPRAFPGVGYEGGRLRLAPGSRLGVKVETDGGKERRAALARRVIPDGQLAAFTVEPRGERRVEVDLRGLLASEPVAKETYRVTLRPSGLPATNELRFYVGWPPLKLFDAPPAPAQAEKKIYIFVEPPARRGWLMPFQRAGLAALFAFALFPFFYRLRAALAGARLARAAQGAQTWQI